MYQVRRSCEPDLAILPIIEALDLIETLFAACFDELDQLRNSPLTFGINQIIHFQFAQSFHGLCGGVNATADKNRIRQQGFQLPG